MIPNKTMNKLKNFNNKLAKYLISYPIYGLSILIPKNRYKAIFIGWHKDEECEIFADNTKYLFLYINNHPEFNTKIKTVWIAKDKQLAQKLREKDLISYPTHSPLGIYHSLTAQYAFIDAYLTRENVQYLGGAKIVQLLHGKGMKKKGYNKKQSRKYNYIVSPSDFITDVLPDHFKQDSQIIPGKFTRNLLAYQDQKNSQIGVDEKIWLQLKNSSNQYNVLYAPTFRRNEVDFKIQDILDLNEKKLKDNNINLYIALHPKLFYISREIKSTGNIHFIHNSDLYPLLKYFDLLVTDYSSIFVDFLLYNKPIVFYAYDYQDYTSNEGFLIDYQKETPGDKVYQKEELIDCILANLKTDNYSLQRQEILNKYFDPNLPPTPDNYLKKLFKL